MSLYLYSCICYPACKAQEPYYTLICGLSGLYISTYLINIMMLGNRKVLNISCVLIFRTTFVRDFWYSTKISVRCYHKYIRYSCRILIKIEVSQQIFQKFSNIKFHENPSSGSRSAPCRQTDGRTKMQQEVNGRFSQFCERA